MITYFIIGGIIAVAFDFMTVGFKEQEEPPAIYLILTMFLWPFVVGYLIFEFIGLLFKRVSKLINKGEND